jgi:hypothetical protein
MAARTPVAAGLVNLAFDSGVAQGAGQAADGTNGNTIADPPGPNHVVLIVKNADASPHSVIVRAGGNGVTASGGANPGTAFTAATVGDLTVAVAAGATQVICVNTTDRFTQADGSISIDWVATPTSVTFWAMILPYNPLSV